MFGFLKADPVKKLRKTYDQKSTDAMLAQRKGDIKTYSMLTAEAEGLWKEIETLEAAKKSSIDTTKNC
jgi:hypothetical protein